MLTGDQVEGFVRRGFVHIPQAFERELALECQEILWRDTGFDPDDRATWTEPVVRVGDHAQEPFRKAANTAKLTEAFDQLVGQGRWVPRSSLGGFPLRFPHPDEPGDTGWHMEGSYLPEGETWSWLNLRSRDRALLMLFLFTEVGPDDAPTRIKVGSHLDVPEFLESAGSRGKSMLALSKEMAAAGKLDSPERETVLATGQPGDVYLCHPFLIHAAQPHRGARPRFMAQPPLYPVAELELERADGCYSPVELAVRNGLGRGTRTSA